jgi:hypothetical protein
MTARESSDCSLVAATRLQVLAFPKYGDNPFLARFSGGLEQQGVAVHDFTFPRALVRRYDVFHVHWPDSHLLTRSWWRALGKHARLALLLWYLRLRGTHIVWMMHNLVPHEKNHWLSSWLFAHWFPHTCTHVIALSQHALIATRNNSVGRVVPAALHCSCRSVPLRCCSLGASVPIRMCRGCSMRSVNCPAITFSWWSLAYPRSVSLRSSSSSRHRSIRACRWI